MNATAGSSCSNGVEEQAGCTRRGVHSRRMSMAVLLAFGLAIWCSESMAQSSATGAQSADPDPARPESTTAPENPLPDLSAQSPAAKSYSLPAFEIIGEEILLNEFNRHFAHVPDYNSNLATIRHNLHSSWVVDDDPFRTNQLGHPYAGSLYLGFARQAGLNFWESLAYDLGGAALWEIAGENTTPSRNDLYNTTVGGAFLGESLFRMSSLLLEHKDSLPQFWRELGAAVISPPIGFDRLAFPNKMDAIFASHNPEYYGRLSVGFSEATQNTQGGSNANTQRDEVLMDFSMDYGLPGKTGYGYTRPFDYFSFQATASSANGVETVATRGLLVGKTYAAGDAVRGVWGLYGTYDYFSPQLYRVSSTGLSLGTTGQWDIGSAAVLQGSALAGAGYAAVGAVAANASDMDYHYGVAPQALIQTRLIFGDSVSIDFSGHEYFVSHVAAGNRDGHDNIIRTDVAVTWRVHGLNAISIRYLDNIRNAQFPDLAGQSQSRATLGIYYTLLGHDRFGAVDWR
jgi:hypothetical protein